MAKRTIKPRAFFAKKPIILYFPFFIDTYFQNRASGFRLKPKPPKWVKMAKKYRIAKKGTNFRCLLKKTSDVLN